MKPLIVKIGLTTGSITFGELPRSLTSADSKVVLAIRKVGFFHLVLAL
jgi:hypothetical protein